MSLFDMTKELDTSTEEGRFYYERGLIPSRVYFVATGAYQDVQRRSFEASITDEAAYDYERAISDSIDPFSIAAVANDVIKPSARIDRGIGITGGWAEPRFRFFMEFSKPLGHGASVKYCYTGFTNVLGASDDGNIDEDMVLHITNMVSMTSHERERGRRTDRVVIDDQVIVNEINYNDSYKRSRGNRRDFIMDPHSALAEYHGSNQLDNRIGEYDSGDRSYPGFAQVGNYARTTRRTNNIPSYYLSNLTSVRRQTNTEDLLEDDVSFDERSYSRQDRNSLRLMENRNFDKDPLVNLYEDTTNIANGASVTWGDLLEMFPSISDDHVTQIMLPDTMRHAYGGGGSSLTAMVSDHADNTVDSNTWLGANIETIIAETLTQQLPAFMMSELIKSINFTVTNEVNYAGDGQYEFIYGNDEFDDVDNRSAIVFLVNGLSRRMEEDRLNAFEMKLTKILLDPITRYGEIGISITVSADVLGECSVSISVEGKSEEQFIKPTYANSISAPILTSDADHFSNFSNSVLQMVDDVISR